MASFNVMAGDIDQGTWNVAVTNKVFDAYHTNDPAKLNDNLMTVIKKMFVPKKIELRGKIASVEVLSDEQVKSAVGAGLWGAAGGLLFGPVGLLAGVLAGGNKKVVAFTCHLKDGRKFLATTDLKTFTRFQAEAF